MSDITNDVKPAAVQLRKAQMRTFIRAIGMLPVLIILGILIQAACVYVTGEGRFLTWQNMSIVAQQASINAVLVISSDLPEIVGIADRVVVMREGITTGEVAGHDITEESIMALATGVAIEKVAA